MTAPDELGSVAVVVPVYANETTIDELVDRLSRVVDAGVVGGVVLVDDASPDGSWAAIRARVATAPGFRAIRLADNQGSLRAIVAGCREVGADVVCVMDADLENAPEDLPRFVAAVRGGADLVSGVRLPSMRRKPIRRAATAVVRLVVAGRWSFAPRDFGCGMKAWRAELAHEAVRRTPSGLGIDWAVQLFGACRRYAEVEIEFHPRGRSSTYGPRRKARQGWELLRAFWAPRRPGRRRAANPYPEPVGDAWRIDVAERIGAPVAF